jgi:hypothetical protein
MTAREKFEVNQRVRLTAYGEQHLIRRRRYRGVAVPTTGIVRGFARAPETVRVQRDGQKTVENYHLVFWDPIE